MMLTDEQCNEFRRLPLSFNDMVRAIHGAGRQQAFEDAALMLDGTTAFNFIHHDAGWICTNCEYVKAADEVRLFAKEEVSNA